MQVRGVRLSAARINGVTEAAPLHEELSSFLRIASWETHC